MIPETISFPWWPAVRNEGYSPEIRRWWNCSLLLLAGHETTINLLCNGTLAFIDSAQWTLFKQDPAGWAKPGDRGVPAL